MLAAFSRLPARAGWAASVASAALLAATQPGACAAVFQRKPAAIPYFQAAVSFGRRAVEHATGALIGGGATNLGCGSQAGAPGPIRSCAAVMSGLHSGALAAGLALTLSGGGRAAPQYKGRRRALMVKVVAAAVLAGLVGLAVVDLCYGCHAA